MMWRHYIR